MPLSAYRKGNPRQVVVYQSIAAAGIMKFRDMGVVTIPNTEQDAVNFVTDTWNNFRGGRAEIAVRTVLKLVLDRYQNVADSLIRVVPGYTTDKRMESADVRDLTNYVYERCFHDEEFQNYHARFFESIVPQIQPIFEKLSENFHAPGDSTKLRRAQQELVVNPRKEPESSKANLDEPGQTEEPMFPEWADFGLFDNKKKRATFARAIRPKDRVPVDAIEIKDDVSRMWDEIQDAIFRITEQTENNWDEVHDKWASLQKEIARAEKLLAETSEHAATKRAKKDDLIRVWKSTFKRLNTKMVDTVGKFFVDLLVSHKKDESNDEAFKLLAKKTRDRARELSLSDVVSGIDDLLKG
ncbi:MAG: hypothetical protein NUW37_18950 [Planctomycetes bacterium]|nr:hypothetical protein [Planctomycetota bacterium]